MATLQGCSSCGIFSGSDDPETASFTLAQVGTKEIAQIIPIGVTLMPAAKSDVLAPADTKIGEVFVNVGDAVKKDAPLVKFGDSTSVIKMKELRAAMKEAEAFVAKDDLGMSTRDAQLEEGKIDQTQYDTIDVDQKAHKATLERVKTELAALEYVSTDSSTINAPFDGVITKMEPLKAGDPVTTGKWLMVVTKVSPLFVSFVMPADDASSFRLGSKLDIEILELGRRKFVAEISNLNSSAVATTPSLDVTASIQNPSGELRDGMRGELILHGNKMQQVYVVPSGALQSRSSGDYIFVVKGNVARETRVKVINVQGAEALVASGVSASDIIISSGAESLSDGDPVTVYNH